MTAAFDILGFEAGPVALELNCSADGIFSFALPLPDSAIAALGGDDVLVTIDNVRLQLRLGREIRLPSFVRTLAEAKYFANAISFQLLFRTIALPPPQAPTIEASIALPPRGGYREVVDLWARTHVANGGAPPTAAYWRILIDRFFEFLGHDQMGRVSAQDVRRYRDHLVETGRNPRTARDSDMAAIRSIFRFAVETEVLGADPTVGVRLRAHRLGASRPMRAFTDEQAVRILAAADRESKPLRRWVPWLTAMTGSRIASIVNLRRQDVVFEDGHWCIRITREAGPVKTAASERIVPLHSCIIARGFIDFVATTDRDYLFVDRTIGGFIVDGKIMGHVTERPYNPGRSSVNRLTEWIRGLDQEIGRAKGKDPNHAWRHWFKERAFAVGVPEKIADTIVGHAQMNVARRYGAVSISVMAEAIEKIAPPV